MRRKPQTNTLRKEVSPLTAGTLRGEKAGERDVAIKEVVADQARLGTAQRLQVPTRKMHGKVSHGPSGQ